MGLKCDQPCPRGFYGIGCRNRCSCPGNAECNATSGKWITWCNHSRDFEHTRRSWVLLLTSLSAVFKNPRMNTFECFELASQTHPLFFWIFFQWKFPLRSTISNVLLMFSFLIVFRWLYVCQWFNWVCLSSSLFKKQVGTWMWKWMSVWQWSM